MVIGHHQHTSRVETDPDGNLAACFVSPAPIRDGDPEGLIRPWANERVLRAPFSTMPDSSEGGSETEARRSRAHLAT